MTDVLTDMLREHLKDAIEEVRTKRDKRGRS
jgi:hypothetical protein